MPEVFVINRGHVLRGNIEQPWTAQGADPNPTFILFPLLHTKHICTLVDKILSHWVEKGHVTTITETSNLSLSLSLSARVGMYIFS